MLWCQWCMRAQLKWPRTNQITAVGTLLAVVVISTSCHNQFWVNTRHLKLPGVAALATFLSFGIIKLMRAQLPGLLRPLWS